MSRGSDRLWWLGGALGVAFAPGAGCLSRDESCVDTSTCEAPLSSRGGTSGEAGVGGQDATAGSGAVAGQAGDSGEAGDSGASGGAAGSAGQGGVGGSGSCACGAWEFCYQGRCLGCSDSGSLSFGPVEALGRAGRYPRPSEQGELFYVQGKKIWYAPQVMGAEGMLLTQEPNVDQTEPLLRIGFDAVLPAQSNFLLYQTEWNGNVATQRPKVALWSPEPPSLTVLADTPEIFSSDTGYNFSLAASAQTNRAWWKRTGFDTVTGFLTAPLDGAASDVEPVSIDVPAGANLCPMDEYIPTAWVTEDGGLLLFRQSRFDVTCEHPSAAPTELYAVPVDVTSGQPTSSAIRLDLPIGAHIALNDPAFGPDCALYFSSELDGSEQLYRAARSE